MDEVERAKYVRAYQWDWYRMGRDRLAEAEGILSGLAAEGCRSLLDVGAGRGEVLALARGLGYRRAFGVEAVPALCDEDVQLGDASALGFADGSFDVVTLFDVIEHLPAAEAEAAILEARRVARRACVFAIASYPSEHEGMQLHITLREPETWDAHLRGLFPAVDLVQRNRLTGTWTCRSS